MLVWTSDTFDTISKHINKAFLSINQKTNMRQLTKSEVLDLETLKLDVLTNLPIMTSATAQHITDIVSAGRRTPASFKKIVDKNDITPSHMTMDKYKKSIIGAYVEFKT